MTGANIPGDMSLACAPPFVYRARTLLVSTYDWSRTTAANVAVSL